MTGSNLASSHPQLSDDLGAAIARAGIDPTLDDRALEDAIIRAIGERRGYCSWDVDRAGWVVTMHFPEEQRFHGRTLHAALAWCLVWLMMPEIGVGQYLI